MSRTHNLKTWPEPYQAVREGIKKFEYRRDDRGFAVGDLLYLHPWDPHEQCYIDERGDKSPVPGTTVEATVTYITRGFGIPEGYVVMGIECSWWGDA